MHLNVKERGDSVATFRWIEVHLMETLAAWVPSTPEMEVKLVFGAHIWDTAQHADALGKRTHELRLPLHDSLQPADAYVELLEDLRATAETGKRIAGFYDGVLPGLYRRMRTYLDSVDTLLDAPTVRVLERILGDGDRMLAESIALRDEVPAVRNDDEAWLADIRARDAAAREIVLYRVRDETVATGV